MKYFKTGKRFVALLLVLAVTLCCFCQPVQVKAVGSAETRILYYSAKSNSLSKTSSMYYGSNVKKISNVKSSNKKIMTAAVKTVKGKCCVEFKIKKTGKVTISYTLTSKNGSTSKVKMNYIIKAYKTPVKTVKVGSKNFSSSFKNSRHISGKAISGKLQIIGTGGWKLSRVYKFKMSELYKDTGVKQVPLKNKSNISVKKGERLVIVMKKGSETQSIVYTAK